MILIKMWHSRIIWWISINDSDKDVIDLRFDLLFGLALKVLTFLLLSWSKLSDGGGFFMLCLSNHFVVHEGWGVCVGS